MYHERTRLIFLQLKTEKCVCFFFLSLIKKCFIDKYNVKVVINNCAGGWVEMFHDGTQISGSLACIEIFHCPLKCIKHFGAPHYMVMP